MSFLTKLFNKTKKPIVDTLIQSAKVEIIKKSENTYQEVNTLQMMRTLIDNDPNSEDIFKHISYKAKSTLPAQSDEFKGKTTIFVPLDEVLLYSYIPDENLGLFDMPKFREYDYRIDLPEYKTFALIFLRDYYDEFLDFLQDNFEPILYTTGEKLYTDKLLSIVDPNNVFKYRLYQDDCHLYKNTKDNLVEYLKDINLFTNRSLKKKILIDYSALNFVLSPDNSNFSY
jgi:TFIIF-interacting CTD phosphatase-like protein